MDLDTALAMLGRPADHDDADLRKAADRVLAEPRENLTFTQFKTASRFQRFALGGKPTKEKADD